MRVPIRKKQVLTIYVKKRYTSWLAVRCESCVHSHILQRSRESEEVTYCYYATLMVVPFKMRVLELSGQGAPDLGAKGGPRHRDPADANIKPAGFRCSDGSTGELAVVSDTDAS